MKANPKHYVKAINPCHMMLIVLELLYLENIIVTKLIKRNVVSRKELRVNIDYLRLLMLHYNVHSLKIRDQIIQLLKNK